MKSYKLKLFLFISIFATFGMLLTNRTEAQDLQINGVQCVEREISCPTGYTQLSRTNGFNAIGNDQKYCVNANDDAEIFGSYINEGESGLSLDVPFLEEIVGLSRSVKVQPRTCATGWNLQRGTESYFVSEAGINIEFYGCCPGSMRFVNQAMTDDDISLSSTGQQGICCNVPNNADSDSISFDLSNGLFCSYTVGGFEQIVPDDIASQIDEGIRFSNTDEVLANLDSADPIQTFILLNPNDPGQEGGLPQLGLPISQTSVDSYEVGSSDVASASIIELTYPGSPTQCPSGYESGCVRTPTGIFTPGVILINELSNPVCQECYLAGEPIAVEDGEVIICEGNGRTSSQELINGNLQDTLAYLNSDEANRDLLRTCRERGGLYLAIGCVEPTPVGIITALIRIGFGVMGGVALVMLILAGLAYQSGDEARIEEAKKRVISVFTGLAVLVFSVLILRIIGINILDVLPQGSV